MTDQGSLLTEKVTSWTLDIGQAPTPVSLDVQLAEETHCFGSNQQTSHNTKKIRMSRSLERA